MNISIGYRDGKIELFDTGDLAKQTSFIADNLLSDFELSLDRIDKCGLWLVAHAYVADACGETEGGATPAARRRRGWRFLLSEQKEVADIEWVRMEEDFVLRRVIDELVDTARLNNSCKTWISGTEDASDVEKILLLSDGLAQVYGLWDAHRQEIAYACGCTPELIERLRVLFARGPDTDSEEATAAAFFEKGIEWRERTDDDGCKQE